MTAVRMTTQIGGYRNGVEWPRPGDVKDGLTPAEAADLIAAGYAKPIDASSEPELEPAPKRRRGRKPKEAPDADPPAGDDASDASASDGNAPADAEANDADPDDGADNPD